MKEWQIKWKEREREDKWTDRERNIYWWCTAYIYITQVFMQAHALSAPPPLAWPSNFVTITDATSTFSLNALAWASQAWPILASITYTILSGSWGGGGGGGGGKLTSKTRWWWWWWWWWWVVVVMVAAAAAAAAVVVVVVVVVEKDVHIQHWAYHSLWDL